jgi:phospholipase/lecithinase/hemolysin
MQDIKAMMHKGSLLTGMRHSFLLALIFVFLVSACSPKTNTTPTPVIPTTVSTPALSGGIGILGDSTSDEYRADDARGGEYADVTLNWVEQLARTRGLDFGKWGTWDAPRRTGYEYNWARTGATIDTMLSSGQHTGLAQQVAEGKVSYVVIWIGNNDFHLKNGPYEAIYSGQLSDEELQKSTDGMVKKITTAMDTILQAGDVKMGLLTITDQGMAPEARILFPDADKRQRVTNVINELNARIAEAARERGVIVIDSNAVGKALFARVDMLGSLEFGSEKISVLTKGDEPHHLQLADNIGHAGTVLSGIIANAVFIQPFDEAFGLDITPLTDEEILQNAGIQ